MLRFRRSFSSSFVPYYDLIPKAHALRLNMISVNTETEIQRGDVVNLLCGSEPFSFQNFKQNIEILTTYAEYLK